MIAADWEVSCKATKSKLQGVGKMQNQFIVGSCHSPADDDDNGRDDDDDDHDEDDDNDDQGDDDAFSLFSTHLGPWHADPN